MINTAKLTGQIRRKLQTTLKSRVTLKGIGLHNGFDCRVIMHPAPANTGIIFKSGFVTFSANVENVLATDRGTTLGTKDASVMTVEHCLSGLKGQGIDNAVLEVDGGEMPALDGSAKQYVDAINQAGTMNLSGSTRPKWRYGQKKPYEFRFKNASYTLSTHPEFKASAALAYPGTPIGEQKAYTQGYATEVAPARTFCLEEEITALRSAGLAKGGSLANAIVVGKTDIQAENGLRFPDEFARHKLLDLIGDLSLLGPGVFEFQVDAHAPGHTANVAFVKELHKILECSN